MNRPDVLTDVGAALRSILPSGAELADSQLLSEATDVRPVEAWYVAAAGGGRRREFVTGRWCARAALRRLGMPSDVTLAANVWGAPSWPPGIVGSITHCPGYCAAVVGSADQFRGIGIDAELNVPTPTSVQSLVCTSTAEYRYADRTFRGNGVDALRLLISIKESVAKAAIHPADVATLLWQTTVEIGAGWFLATTPDSRDVSGRWVFVDGFFVSAATDPIGPESDGRSPRRA